ncbi:TolA-binding protein [Natranaerovirga hydrolytica]|uniref:TolA-binding protein n=1 Tax=Natranaerovirga hydrolytica TaxID=680378 RepID=A0A4R1MJ55_9FIRM|nr:tetratricopeptide repeat protein [Natranaerovirga hydrolytica]TCK92445.1 TolA-binding protein [Natranaerovirga hydrolytica]
MICPKCGNTINEDDFCTKCDMKVSFYNKIKNTSKSLYNEGLQKAKVRDLTGAIDFLKRSLIYDKKNIEARNLLGLIYFEIGEVVRALEQWIISKNFKSEDNIAQDYIDEVQNNQHKLDKLNTAIKKYNQSLRHIEQNSLDLAIIQLKKIISLNPNFVKAYCLLTLLYIKEEEFEKGKKTILKVLSIDKNNYTALKYLEILNQDQDSTKDFEENILLGEQKTEKKKRKTKERNAFSDNLSYMYQIGYILVGLIIGALLVIFLVMPHRVNSQNETIDRLENERDSIERETENRISDLEDQLNELTSQVDEKNQELESYYENDAYFEAVEQLQIAVELYLDNNTTEAANKMVNIEENALGTTTSHNIYNYIKEEIYLEAARNYYNSGYANYQRNNFEESIEVLSNVEDFDYEDRYTGDALYFIARSYQQLGQDQEAINIFDRVIEEYSGTTRASNAQFYKNQIVD